jgi:hypothetical protein
MEVDFEKLALFETTHVQRSLLKLIAIKCCYL